MIQHYYLIPGKNFLVIVLSSQVGFALTSQVGFESPRLIVGIL